MTEQNSIFAQTAFKKADESPSVTVDIVRNLDDLKAVFEIRRKSFVIAKGVDEKMEFDGNDFTCTHVLMKVNQKPAGTLRIRCFKDFAKMERLCIDEAYRGKELYKHLLDYTEEYLTSKGYDCFVGYILSELSDYWFARGFKPNSTMNPEKKGNITLLPVIYPFKPRKVSKYHQRIDLLAKEGKIKEY